MKPTGALTGIRDQGLTLHQNPQQVPPADYIGEGTPAEQAKAKADRERHAAAPPHRAVIETNCRC